MNGRQGELRKFFFKLTIFFLPFIVFSILYVLLDPFKVLYKYDDYGNWVAEPCRDYVSTQSYLNHRETALYDSFILGSSRSKALECRDWAKYEKDASCFHFDASGENIYGVQAKLKLIDSKHDAIRRVIWVVESETFKTTEDLKGHLSIKHPALSGRSPYSFHLIFFEAYFQKLFFLKFIDSSLFKHWRPYMGDVIYREPVQIQPITNDENAERSYHAILEAKGLDDRSKNIFYSREGIDHYSAKPLIDSKRVAMLKDIRAIFNRHHTRYKIIVSPLYDQVYFNHEDLKVLKDIFGTENVLDYSGVNEFTSDANNYYEVSHYKSEVAQEILRRIYPQAS